MKRNKGRSQSRVIKFSKRQIEQRIERLKRRMNKFYQEILACQQALQYFEQITPQEVVAAQDKEAQLREQIVAEVEKAQAELIEPSPTTNQITLGPTAPMTVEYPLAIEEK